MRLLKSLEGYGGGDGFGQSSQGDFLARVGLLHLTLRVGGGMAMTSVAMLLIPRFMQPEDMGLASLSLGIFAFLLITCEGGFRAYAIRRDLKETPVLQGHLLLTQVAHVIFLLLVLSGVWSVGRFFLSDIWMNALPMVVVMLGLQPLYFRRQMATAPLERGMDFRAIGRMELTENFSYNIALVVSAMASCGAWSFVVAHAARCVVSYVQSLRIPFSFSGLPWRQWFSGEIRDAYRYGFTLQGAQWTHNLRGMLTTGFIVSFAGAPALGLFDRAQTVGNAALGVMQNISERFLFAYSSKNYPTNPEKCRKVLARAVKFITWIDKAIYLLILLVGLPLVIRFWGVKWDGIAPLVPVVALGAAVFGSITFPTYPFLTSIGHVDFVLKMAILALGVTVIAGPPLILNFGVMGACWLGVIMWAMSFIWLVKAQKVLGRFEWFYHWTGSVVVSILVYFFASWLFYGGIYGRN